MDESTFMYILDLCQDFDINDIQYLIDNLKVLIENKECDN